jgi:hypothetical protein
MERRLRNFISTEEQRLAKDMEGTVLAPCLHRTVRPYQALKTMNAPFTNDLPVCTGNAGVSTVIATAPSSRKPVG